MVAVLRYRHCGAGRGAVGPAAGQPRGHRQAAPSGFRLGLATNDSTGGAEKTLLALGVAQMFDAAYGYDAVANPKPAPDSIYAFSDLTGLKPSEIAMVGDNRHDLEMAQGRRRGTRHRRAVRHRHPRKPDAAGRRGARFDR